MERYFTDNVTSVFKGDITTWIMKPTFPIADPLIPNPFQKVSLPKVGTQHQKCSLNLRKLSDIYCLHSSADYMVVIFTKHAKKIPCYYLVGGVSFQGEG